MIQAGIHIFEFAGLAALVSLGFYMLNPLRALVEVSIRIRALQILFIEALKAAWRTGSRWPEYIHEARTGDSYRDTHLNGLDRQ